MEEADVWSSGSPQAPVAQGFPSGSFCSFYGLATSFPGQWRRPEYSHTAVEASDSGRVMIELRAQADPFFVEAERGFIFSGGPTIQVQIALLVLTLRQGMRPIRASIISVREKPP